MTAVAFLGLGRMGQPMVRNLIRAGHEVTVWNRTTEKAEAFASEHGARAADSPESAAEGADVVVTMLADDAAVTEAFVGPTGALSAMHEGAVAVDMSTVQPRTARLVADAARDQGVMFLDAPVSGSVDVAAAGTLTIMVGGQLDAFERAHPVLDAMGTPVHLGDVGTGASMKLAVNTVVHGLNGAVSEALVLAERSGIERETAYEIFTRSVIAAPFVNFRRAAFERPDEVPVAFRLVLAAKDLRCAVQLAEDVGAALPQSERALTVLDAAAEAGFGERDESAVAAYLRSR